MEKITDKISVITVCYNCKDDLEKTINSVLSQTYDNIEFVVVDGDSKDGTKDVLNRYKEKIDICISEPDDGIYDAMNKGIRVSHGDWLIFMNAGDQFCDANVLKEIFQQGIPSGKQFIYSDYFLVRLDGKEELWKTDRSRGVVHHQSAIYKRSLHETYGFYIVTHPYIISDLMFFLAVPENLFFKTETKIARVKDGGVSTGTWIREEVLCIQRIYGIHSFRYIIFDYIKMRIGMLLRKLHIK